MNGKLIVMDLKRQEVQDVIATIQDEGPLFSSGLAYDYK